MALEYLTAPCSAAVPAAGPIALSHKSSASIPVLLIEGCREGSQPREAFPKY
jgi:hypothetical protein